MVVAAAMRLEAGMARRALRGTGVEVVRLGMRGTRMSVGEGAGPLVVVGVCGALAPLRPGTVVVPDEVGEPEGGVVRCDPELSARLRAAAAGRGWPVRRGRLLTVPAVVSGAARERWAARGFDAVDMETAPVLGRSGGAAVRVVLDGPDHELPELSRMLDPRQWPAAIRVAAGAPRYARRAAAVVADVVAAGTLPG